VGLRGASPEGTPKDLATSGAWPQLMGCATGSPECPRQGSSCKGANLVVNKLESHKGLSVV
jgi:coenzyme F420-reducing hydrogenase gamma subunit